MSESDELKFGFLPLEIMCGKGADDLDYLSKALLFFFFLLWEFVDLLMMFTWENSCLGSWLQLGYLLGFLKLDSLFCSWEGTVGKHKLDICTEFLF